MQYLIIRFIMFLLFIVVDCSLIRLCIEYDIFRKMWRICVRNIIISRIVEVECLQLFNDMKLNEEKMNEEWN